MREIFEGIKTTFVALAAVLLTCFAAWASGISVPENSRLNVNSGELHVELDTPGSVVVGGVIATTTGSIHLNGDWTVTGIGYYDPGTGHVFFTSAAAAQDITPGTVTADAFYDLTHEGAADLNVLGNADIDGTLYNLDGTIYANSHTITVAGDWVNTSAVALSFVAGQGLVDLNGTDQEIQGATIFYDLTKQLAAAGGGQLTFPSGVEQTITHQLTLRGFGTGADLLALRASVPGTAAELTLQAGGAQAIRYVDVLDNDASGGLLLIGRLSPDHADTGIYNNTNWAFGSVTVTWDGTEDDNWDNPFNWDLGLVPESGDTAIIPVIDTGVYDYPMLRQAIDIGALQIDANAYMTLAGYSVDIDTDIYCAGTIVLNGTETVTSATMQDYGTFKYIGWPAGMTANIDIADDFVIGGVTKTTYHGLILEEQNPAVQADTFIMSASLNILTDATFTAGALTLSAGTTLTVVDTMTVNGATVTAINASLALDMFVLSTGTLSAPSAARTFTVSGDFTHDGGTFTYNDGTVTLNGINQSVNGTTEFYRLSKVMPEASQSYTLTFEAGETTTVHDRLILQGIDQDPAPAPDDPLRRLNIVSSTTGTTNTAANLYLLPGGVQEIRNVAVFDNHAGFDPTQVWLVGRGSSSGTRTVHWLFGAITLKWDGSLSTAWEEPANWDYGVAPVDGDTAWVRYWNEDMGGAVVDHLPILATDVSLDSLYVRDAPSTLALMGHGLEVANLFSNDGTIYLQGGEALNIVAPDTDSGAFIYYGDGAGTPMTITGGTKPTQFFDLGIRNPDAGTASVFTLDTDLAIYGSLTVAGAELDASAVTLDIGNDFVMTGGVFTAPGSTEEMAVFDDFTHTAGTFDANGGIVILDGTSDSATSEQVLTGNTTFYNLRKRRPAGAQIHRLTLDSTAVQTITGRLDMGGVAGALLQLRSTSTSDPVVQAGISLAPGGLQSISYIDVQDSNAGATGSTGFAGLTLVARPDYVDGGNHTNWMFGAAELVWTGTYSNYWGDARNWDLGMVPIAGDSVTIPDTANDPHLDYVAPNVPPAPTVPAAIDLNDLTLNVDATLYLDGYDMSVSGAMLNYGNLSLHGDETLTIITPDTTNGTFTYTGTDPASTITLNILGPGHTPLTYHNLVIAAGAGNIFQPATNLVVNGDLTVSGGTLDVSTGTRALTVGGDMTLTGGTLEAQNASIALTGSVTLGGGTLSAPDGGGTFTVGGGWTNTSGTFTPYDGRVTFSGAGVATISGNTTFWDFSILSVGVDKTIYFAEGSNQTITDDLELEGDPTNKLFLRSTTDSTPGHLTPWYLTILYGPPAPLVNNVDVRDSTAVFPNAGTGPDIMALNSIDHDNDGVSTNIHWRFFDLDIVTPDSGKTVSPTPTIIGHGVPGEAVTLIDGTGAVIATALPDANGNFRVVVGNDDAGLGTVTKFALDSDPANPVQNTITPVYNGYSGNSSTFWVVVAPTPSQVPVIDEPVDGAVLIFNKPTIIGRGLPGASVYVVSKDEEDLYLLSVPPEAYMNDPVVVGADGTFSAPLVRPLSRGENYVSVIVDGVSSSIFTYILHELHGTVFDSTSGNPVNLATVSLLNPDGSLARPGVELDPDAVNPVITGADGKYSFWLRSSDFKIQVEATGFAFPTELADSALPGGFTIVTPGSRGEVFHSTGNERVMDLPLDGSPYAFRVEKTANKKEAKIGEVVTYTVTMESLLDANTVYSPRLFDNIPPGFKFMNGRAQMEGVPMADPSGNRPLWFDVGTFTPHQKRTVRYQLVIGSGVAPGNYENAAWMKHVNGIILSNKATETVKVTLDPLFDAGTVFGKVFYDLNENGRQDDPEYVYEDRQEIVEGPVPNARLVMEDGTVVTADINGQFHVPALLPGRHLLRLDERSLPPGAYLTTDKVQVVDVTAGSIVKVNFGVNIDNLQITGDDAVFFQKEVVIDQSASQPKPKLNVNVFNDEILLHNDMVIEQIEFRMFTNYAPFFTSWQLDVIDVDTKKIVRSFKGTRYNVFDPVYWDGRDAAGQYLRSDRHYAYVLKVKDDQGKWDETREQALSVKVMTDLEMARHQRERSAEEKTQEAAARADKYRVFLAALATGDALKMQNIWVKGDTLVLKPMTNAVRQVRVLKNGELVTDIPVLERRGLTARELVEGGAEERSLPMEVILPDGDYALEVVSAAGGDAPAALPAPVVVADAAGTPVNVTEPVAARTAQYTKPIKVGEDYMMFVAMGDGKAGYNLNRGSIEPVQSNESYQRGFYTEGKLAYYLKGKIKGKYIVTSSFDTERQRKEALRTFKDEEYYPVYGDASTINYDATDTEGPLYLSVEWDKSQAIWGNYAVAFNDRDFANYTRSLYGGKLDYKSVASTEYGEAKTRVAVFHAEVRQRSAHNELLGTGGSLYYLKHNDVVAGTDKVRLEVRDGLTGLVRSTVEMKEGVDYDIDEANGRLLFWKPVSMAADSGRLVADGILSGDPVYVVADYEYFVHDKLAEATRGARVAQALGKNVVAGATYVSETQADKNYQLQGADVTIHMGKDATVQAEYAETSSDAQNNYISTDGGITFSKLALADNTGGKAYGIKQDARIFDRVGLKSYYKWIGDGFSTGKTVSQQGKESKGLALTFDLTPVTRLTASRDIQRLIERGNLQTAMQVGAKETTTTIIQLVHEARRLRLTEEFQSVEVKGADGITQTQKNLATAAAQAEYALDDKTDLLLRHQASLSGEMDQLTTVGIRRQVTDKLSVNVEESFGVGATATKIEATANVTPRLALSTGYTMAQTRVDGMTHTASLGATGMVGDRTSLDATASVTQSAAGAQTSTVTLGGTRKLNDKTSLQALASTTQSASGAQEHAMTVSGMAKVDDITDVKVGVETTQSSDTAKARQAIGIDGVRKGTEGRETTAGVKVADTATDGKMTIISAGEKGQLTPASQLAAERSFAFGPGKQEQADTYKVITTKDGRAMETSYARKFLTTQTQKSDSNIFGLTGDVNDRVALQASLERGKAYNLDGTVYDRVAISGGLGYVEKDTETGKTVLQSSTKAEVRFDSGEIDRQQYVFYQSVEGRVNDQTTVRGKFSYSTTKNMTTKKEEAGYKEIMLGAAYRPIANDRVNIFGEYTYKENKGPAGQTTATDIEETKIQVLTAGASYELNEKWELVEKLALRIMEEKVSGFEFAKTHTWLLVNRANYRLNQDWKIGAEYRILTVKEAKDQKRGMLVEAVHSVNDNVELGIGYNFTNFVDDLTNLSYTVQGPYIRMTGKLYDQSPEERARAKARWMDRRVELYAAKMVKKEFDFKDSEIVAQLNRMYQAARSANEQGKYEESRELYKNIILTVRMMYEEAAQFVRRHIAFEESVFNAYQRAREYYDKGEFWQARKLWEKVVEEASKAVLE